MRHSNLDFERGHARDLLIGLMTAAVVVVCNACRAHNGDVDVDVSEQPFSNQFPSPHCPLGCPPIHEQITVGALSFLRLEVRNALAVLNATFDATHILDADAHFDNCTFSDTSFLIRQSYVNAVDHALVFPPPFVCPDFNSSSCAIPLIDSDAIRGFAAALHPIQDFYSHSNWVEIAHYLGESPLLLDDGLGEFPLLQGGQILPSLPGALVADNLQSARRIRPPAGNREYPESVIPSACTFGQPGTPGQSPSCIPALITGQTGLSFPNACPNNIHIEHDGELAKDMPDITDPIKFANHVAAVGLARAQTTHEWCRLVSLVRDRHGQAGDSKLYDNWVEDRDAARCGPPTDLAAGSSCQPPTSTPLEPSESRTYQLEITNLGPAPVYGASWIASFSGALASIVGAGISAGGVATSCSVSGLTVACRAPTSLVPAETAVITLTIEAGSPGSISMTARVSSHHPDPIGSNDAAAFSFIVECPAGQTWDPVAGECVTATVMRAYVTTGTSQTVAVINVSSSTLITEIPVGNLPAGIALTPGGTRAYVANFLSGSVSVINTTTNSVIGTVGVSGTPFGVAVSADGSHVYVTNPTLNMMSVIDRETDSLIANVPVGQCPQGIAVTPDGTRIYVANACSSTVTAIDATSNAVVSSISLPLSVPSYLSVSPDGSKIYVAHQSSRVNFSIIDVPTNTLISTEHIGTGGAGWLSVAPDGAIFLPILNGTTRGIIELGGAGRFYPGSTTSVGLNLDGSRVYAVGIGNVDNVQIAAVRVLDRATASLLATIPISSGSLGGIAIGLVPL